MAKRGGMTQTDLIAIALGAVAVWYIVRKASDVPTYGEDAAPIPGMIPSYYQPGDLTQVYL